MCATIKRTPQEQAYEYIHAVPFENGINTADDDEGDGVKTEEGHDRTVEIMTTKDSVLYGRDTEFMGRRCLEGPPRAATAHVCADQRWIGQWVRVSARGVRRRREGKGVFDINYYHRRSL